MKIPPSWQDKPHKRSQKDADARWTKKGGRSYFGYKDHICIDAEHGLIRRYAVTDAAVHDSQVFAQLLDDQNESDTIWADSGYRCEAIEEASDLIVKFMNGHIATIHSLKRKSKQIAPSLKLVPKSSVYLEPG